MEKQFEQIAIRESLRLVRGVQPQFDGSLADAFVINSPPIVFHFDINVIAAMVSAYRNIAMIGLTSVVPLFAAFKTVSNGVADQVNQRIRNLLDDAVVELSFSSRES